jgi:hypothetical protein
MICSYLNRARFIFRLLRGDGLHSNLKEFSEPRSSSLRSGPREHRGQVPAVSDASKNSNPRKRKRRTLGLQMT